MPTLTRSIFRRRPVEDRALPRENVQSFPSLMLQPSLAGPSVNADSALRIVDVLACVRVLAATASTLPLKTYVRSGDERQPYRGALTALLDRPSPGNTQANLIAQLVGSLALRGNAYLGKFKNEGAIEQVALLPPDRVRVALIRGEPLYTLTSDRGETVHTSADILHFKGLSMDGVVGLSPIAQGREALGLGAALEQYAAAMFGNSATPLGVLSVPANHPAQGELMDSLRHGIESRHRGADKAGRIAVLSGDISWQALSLTPSDAEFVASRHLSTQEIARLFAVPVHLIGGPTNESMTYSNVESEAMDFVRFSLSPWLTLIEQGISADPDLTPPDVFVEFLLDSLLRPDTATRAEVYAKALDPERGWMNRSEVRRLENLPPERDREVIEVG
jgi:HK97 family phage portal protein